MSIFTEAIFTVTISKALGAIVALGALFLMLFTVPSSAQGVSYASGRVTLTEGHESPACRRVKLERVGAEPLWFRIPQGEDTGILAVALTALTTGKRVDIAYQNNIGSGCGGEPRIIYISLYSE